jgi:hypothetical protein
MVFNRLKYYKIRILFNHISKRLNLKNFTPIAPLILACVTTITLFASIIGFNVISDVFIQGGLITLHPPSNYVIIRELEGFPSDHIIIPVDFYNSWRAKSEIIRQPYLIMRNKTKEIRFHFMGELPKYSRENFEPEGNKELDRSGTFIISPSSLSTHAMVFQVEGYANECGENYAFRFESNDSFQCGIGYERWNGKHFKNKYEASYFQITIPNLKDLSRQRNYFWDWYAFNSSTGDPL